MAKYLSTAYEYDFGVEEGMKENGLNFVNTPENYPD